MQKSKNEKAAARIMGIATADKMEWERIIENPAFQKAIKNLQREFRLPIKCSGFPHLATKEVTEWMGWNDTIEINETTGQIVGSKKVIRRNKLTREEKELADHFSIPSKFLLSLHRLVILDLTSPDITGGGFPTTHTYKRKDGELVHECIITPTTDLDNPLVWDYIKHWQEVHRDKPPQPLPVRVGAKPLDWRPVWEWHKRHPSVSDREIALMLDKNRVTVSREFEKLDKEHLLQI
jgi:hypothetical protein